MTAKQGLPEPTRDYTGFPTHTVTAGEVMYRAHSQGAWYFANKATGRFDLRGARGTCYTAVDVRTAVREKLRDKITGGTAIQREEAERFVISKMRASFGHTCAAASSEDAEKFGVVRELTTMADYSVPQAWATTFDDSGFDGVFYGSAYTTGDTNAYALFGPAGEPPAGSGFDAEEFLSGVEACRAIGLKVEDLPSSAAITYV